MIKSNNKIPRKKTIKSVFSIKQNNLYIIIKNL